MKQLKEKIIELVPEIKELNIGCVVLFEDHKIRLVENTFPKYLFVDELGWRYYGIKENNKLKAIIPSSSNGEGIREFKIIGRPITLEDVLRAIEKKPDKGEDIDDYILKTNGEIYLFMMSPIKKMAQWQLGKPLDDQLEEVIAFLKEVLNP